MCHIVFFVISTDQGMISNNVSFFTRRFSNAFGALGTMSLAGNRPTWPGVFFLTRAFSQVYDGLVVCVCVGEGSPEFFLGIILIPIISSEMYLFGFVFKAFF